MGDENSHTEDSRPTQQSRDTEGIFNHFSLEGKQILLIKEQKNHPICTHEREGALVKHLLKARYLLGDFTST